MKREERLRAVCKYWKNCKEEKKDVKANDLCEVFDLSKTTIISYLKEGTSLGLCEYNPKEEKKLVGKYMSNLNKKKIKVISLGGVVMGVYDSVEELREKSEKDFGVNFDKTAISRVANGKRKQAYGYLFEYLD